LYGALRVNIKEQMLKARFTCGNQDTSEEHYHSLTPVEMWFIINSFTFLMNYDHFGEGKSLISTNS